MHKARAVARQAKAVADLAEQHKCHDELLHEINAKLDTILARLDGGPAEPAKTESLFDKSSDGGGPLKNRVQGSK